MATGGDLSFQESMQNTELIKVSNEKHKYINTSYEKVSAKMYDYNCDVKLKVGPETFKAHRDVLGEASVYFSAMFSHDMKEKEQDVIELKEISPRGFTAMMEYFYHGHVTVDPDNIEDVIEAARFFHIEWLVHVSCDFLIRYLSLENYDVVLHLVDKYFLGDLRPGIFSFASQNFMTLAEKPKFMQLSYDLLYLLLAEDHYIDATESFILDIVLKWLKHDEKERDQYKLSLLELIRYPLVELQALEEIPPDFLEISSVKALVDDAKDYNVSPTRQCLLASDNTEVRGAQDVLALYSGLEDARQVHYKVPHLEGLFTENIDTGFMESVFEFASVAVLGNFLFVAGGYGRHSWCSSPAFYSYNARNRLWAQLSSMQQPRVSFALCASDTGLYAIAGVEHIVRDGHDQEHILNTVEFYNPVDNLWHGAPELPYGCFSIAAVVVEEKIFITGGITSDPEHNVPVNYMQMFNPREKTWVAKENMNVERHGHAMVAHNNQLFVFGGYTTGPDTMNFDVCQQNEVYDIETSQWSLLRDTPPDFERIHSTAAVIDDTICVLGGSRAQRYIYKYNKAEDQLEDAEPCGRHTQKLVKLKVAFPADIM